MQLRLDFARQLLMQGHGRWRAIPLDHRNPEEDPWEAEAKMGMEEMAIDADGSLINRQQLFEEEEHMQSEAQLGAPKAPMDTHT